MSVICGDCLEEMRKMEDNSISAIVTDPPYGLSFMGKGWDYALPSTDCWKEAFRILKPGGFLLAMGGTRTFHRLACSIEDAGFEIRDCISWLYGSGFPKSHNHLGIEGYGTALKPAWEPCIMAMKKCDGTFKQNAEKWRQAGINIDGCRIGTSRPKCDAGSFKAWRRLEERKDIPPPAGDADYNKGRWPANVILDEEAGEMLDEQSGISISRPDKRSGSEKKDNNCYHGGWKHAPNDVSDSGGASRFFYCAKASSSERNDGLDSLPDQVGKRTQDGGNDTRGRPIPVNKNNHPTVKPLKLMEYLIKLIMPPKDGILLDPFAGSGTTILAAHKLGIKAIGIEKQQEYCDIANARVAHYIQNNLKFG